MLDKLIGLWNQVNKPLSDAKNFIMSCEDNLDSLEKEINELRSQGDDLRSKVIAADRQGKKVSNTATWLLARVKGLDDEAQTMRGRYNSLVKCLGGLHADVFTLYKLSHRAEQMLPEVKDLIGHLGFTTNVSLDVSVPEGHVERLVSSAVGVESVLEQLRQHIKDENVCRIGVYGMGGVGKTELLGELNNQLHEMNLDCVIWVDMPEDSNTEEIQLAVGQWLGIDWQENTPLKERARLITKELKHKKFVLILDGVWKPLDLRDVGIPVLRPPTKSNIILTTRIEGICDKMDVKAKVRVKCMKWDEAWNLFVEKAGKKFVQSNKEIRGLAKELVGKCGGLPPALIQLGQAMASRKTKEQWQLALTIMDVAPWELLGTQIFSDLRPSYDNLPNDQLRTCLLYCSLYPEGFPIYKEWIIDYCIGEGIIGDIYISLEQIYNKGHEMLGVLKAVSLLESGDDEHYIKMHPVVRGLALWIASDWGQNANKWVVRPQAGLDEAPSIWNWKDAERVSLMRNKIKSISEIPESPNVQTLLLQRNLKLEKICDSFFMYMTKLRVLDLSHTLIKELPAGIEVLVELRYLDLCNTYVKSLPRELAKLKKLRFLLLSYMLYLKHIPEDVISCLSELQVLYLHVSYGNWKVGSVGDGVDFDELNHLKQLTTLGLTVKTVQALQRLGQSNRLASCTRKLHIRGCQGLTAVDLPSTILGRSMKRLQLLQIADSHELKEVTIDSGDVELSSRFPSLEILVLNRLRQAKIVWRSGWVQNLCYLTIQGCAGMKHLVNFDGDGDDDEGGVEIEEQNDEEHSEVIDPFPNLKQMQLRGLPELKTMSGGRRMVVFPSLESLFVVSCRSLTKLDMKAEKLMEIRGEKQWWKKLVVKQDNMKSLFLPLE